MDRIKEEIKEKDKNDKEEKIRKEPGIRTSNGDKFIFKHAPLGDYWKCTKTKEKPSDPKKKKGRVFEISAPECYPVTTTKSFWETTKDDDSTLLKKLLEGKKEINWDEVSEGAWPSYMYAKFHKAVQLLEYWNPDQKKALEEGKEREWAQPLLELFTRLKLEKELSYLRGRDNKERKHPKTYQNFHNLKVWAIFASYGGVYNPNSLNVTIPLTLMDKKVMQTRLSSPQIGYLRGGKFGLGGDQLSVT